MGQHWNLQNSFGLQVLFSLITLAILWEDFSFTLSVSHAIAVIFPWKFCPFSNISPKIQQEANASQSLIWNY